MEAVQIVPSPTPTPTLIHAKDSSCASLNLPSGGVIALPDGQIITLTSPAAFIPVCTQLTQPAIIANGGGGLTVDESAQEEVSAPQFSDFRDPFYASTFPQCYALAATTVVAYTLVIMLFITPRSFLDGGVVVLGRRGFTTGGTGGTNIGGRPWLQKVAALMVAISLTIATADTFRVAEEQYSLGIQNAQTLQQDVLGGTELKVIRIVSEAFLWLAQAQTLIRLFPRQREKVIIKWTAFALIGLGVIFDSLNSFLYTNQGALRPRSFTDAIPALSYLFQLSLGVLYAAWVIYYSLMKKRFAFYHRQMRNMCLVALLSILAIIVPVVFFVLDISKPEFTGWGDYVRWVGAAAASVIVWEWVERIEALEREEKKDGILGREVFDGDEMLDMTPGEFAWPRRRKTRKGKDGDDGGEDGGARNQTSTSGRSNLWPTMSSIATRYRPRSRTRNENQNQASEVAAPEATNAARTTIRFLQPPLWPARPPPAVTPVSRTDTASADSTVYAVRYQAFTDTTSRTTPPPQETEPSLSRSNSVSSRHSSGDDAERRPAITPEPSTSASQAPSSSTNNRWRAFSQANQLFRKPSRSNTITSEGSRPSKNPRSDHEDSGRWDLRGRLEDFAVTQAERLRERIRPTPDTESLPVTVIPAPPRRGAALAQLLEEEEHPQRQDGQQLAPQISRADSSVSRQAALSGPGPVSTRMWRSDSSTSASASSPRVSTQPVQGFPLSIRATSRRESEPPFMSPIAQGKQPADGSPNGAA